MVQIVGDELPALSSYLTPGVQLEPVSFVGEKIKGALAIGF